MPERRRHHHKREEQPINEQPNPFSNILGNFNISNLAGIINSIDINELTNSINSNSFAPANGGEMDEGTMRKEEIANSLRTLINCDKSELIQVLLRFYALRKPVKK